MRVFAVLLLPLICIALPAGAKERPAEYSVRIMAIDAPESVAARAAMTSAPSDDQALFEQTTELVATGAASLAGDTIVRCGTGRWKVETRKEIPYGTEFSVDANNRQVIPGSFTFRNAGITMHGEVTPAASDGQPALTIQWTRTRYAGRKAFPVRSVKAFTDVEQPVFLNERIVARVSAGNGRWQLAGMTGPAAMEGEPTDRQRTIMTFVKVSDGTHRPAPAAVSTNTRLHLLVFRVPVTEGMAMATRPAGSDEALLESLLTRAENGEVLLVDHTASTVCGKGEPDPGSEAAPAPDPFAGRQSRESGESRAENLIEYAYAAHYGPDPKSFTYQNIGSRFSVLPGRNEAGGAESFAVKWDAPAGPVRLISLTPQPEGATMTAPEFSTQALKLRVSASQGIVRLVGAVLRPDNGGAREMDVGFLKLAGQAADSGRISGDHTEAWAALISLPANDGARLAARGRKADWNDIEPFMKHGTARLLAWQCAGGMPGTDASMKRTTDTPVATKAAAHEASGVVYGTHTTFHTLGDSVQLRLPEATGASFDGKFTVDLQWPEPPALVALLAAAKDGTKLPGFVRTETVFPAAEENGPSLEFDHLQIVSLSPCAVREGHPEHGRWHAVVLRVRAN